MSQQINLYNPLLLKRQKPFSLNTMAAALGLIFAGTLLFYAYVSYNTSELQERADEATRLHNETLARLERMKAASNQRAPSKLLEEEVARLDAQLKARQEVVALLKRNELGNTQGFSEHFRAFARQTTDGLWLTGFEVSGSGEVTISGRAIDPELVPVFIDRLKREKVLAGKTFTTLEMRLSETAPAAGSGPGLPRYHEFILRNTEAGAAR